MRCTSRTTRAHRRSCASPSENGLDGRYVQLLLKLSATIDEAAGRHVTINATGALAALLLEIGIPAEIVRAIAVVSRCAGLVGHILEEQQTDSARHLVRLARETIPYRDPRRATPRWPPPLRRRRVRRQDRQNNPTILPSGADVDESAAGTRGRPGMVMISPQIATTNSAPAESRTSRTLMV